MIGEVRYWFSGDCDVICAAYSDEVVTLCFFGRDGHYRRGPVQMRTRFWDRLHAV